MRFRIIVFLVLIAFDPLCAQTPLDLALILMSVQINRQLNQRPLDRFISNVMRYAQENNVSMSVLQNFCDNVTGIKKITDLTLFYDGLREFAGVVARMYQVSRQECSSIFVQEVEQAINSFDKQTQSLESAVYQATTTAFERVLLQLLGTRTPSSSSFIAGANALMVDKLGLIYGVSVGINSDAENTGATTIGNTTSGGIVTIEAADTSSVSIANTIDKFADVNIGAANLAATGASSTQTIKIGTGTLNHANSTKEIELGAGIVTAGTRTIAIGTGTHTGTRTITIGGTAAGTSDQTSIEASGAATVNIGYGTATGAVLIGNSTGKVGIGGAVGTQLLTVNGSEEILLGNLYLPNTTTTPYGAVYFGGDLTIHNYESGTPGNSIFVGKNAGNLTQSGAASNTGVGFEALNDLTSGDYNVALGYNAGAGITDASNNTIIGYQAGDAALTTAANGATLVGYRAGTALTTGAEITAVGCNALAADVSSNSNTAVGFSALLAATGSENTAVGSYAGAAQTSGVNNTLIGRVAGRFLTTANNTTAVGKGALYSNNTDKLTGNDNTAVGNDSGYGMTSGIRNTLVGVSAGVAMTSGGSNIAIGYNAGSTYTTESNNIVIGNNGTGTDSGVIRIGTAGTHSSCYVSGITGVNVGATANFAVVDGDGQLGDTATTISTVATTININNSGAGAVDIGNTTGGVGILGTVVAGDLVLGNDAAVDVVLGNSTGTVGITSSSATLKGTSTGSVGINVDTAAATTTNIGTGTTTGAVLIGNATGKVGVCGDVGSYALNVTGTATITSGDLQFTGGKILFPNANIPLITVAGQRFLYSTSNYQNLFLGYRAGNTGNVTDNYNVGIGPDALYSLTTGYGNLAIGAAAGANITDADGSIAFGHGALYKCTTGNNNFAIGENSLNKLTTQGNNFGLGYYAGAYLTGTYNIGIGHYSVRGRSDVLPMTGNNNIAIGQNVLRYASTAQDNVAIGYEAMIGNSTDGISGGYNVAIGSSALFFATTAANNTGVGYQALTNLTTGGSNIALGYTAGSTYDTESSNIVIGNIGTDADANTIRIGTAGSGAGQQDKCYIVGIDGVTVAGGVSVLVGDDNQLGTVTSSRRFKENISDMANASAVLTKLRPVIFNYKDDKTQSKQYGLVAEEVHEVFPDLVAYRQGLPSSVKYHVLPALLLNEWQKDHKVLEKQQKMLQEQQKVIDEMRAQIKELKK